MNSPTAETIFSRIAKDLSTSPMCDCFRVAFRLIGSRQPVTIAGVAIPQRNTNLPIAGRLIVRAVRRYEESIAGRAYLIEVAHVATDRWRAYIVRVPGVPTALMPFYGRTPEEAAQMLSNWLSRAHGSPQGLGQPV